MPTSFFSVIPRPLRVVTPEVPSGVGAVLGDGLVITYAPELAAEARWFRRLLESGTGWSVELAPAGGDRATGTVDLKLAEVRLGDAEADAVPERARHEAYRLEVSGGHVVVTAEDGAGVFYGLQTLRQLLPASVFRQAPPFSGGAAMAPVELAEVDIADGPHLSWRGVHLDVCRHFMPKGFVLKLIDLASLHKCNVFHLHLTDDQGWRVPIEAYPRLTEVGAWRRESSLGHLVEWRFDGTPHGGFYSREDLAEIVAFATERHMTLLPEIDMPGHMVAAIAAYPELGNTDEPVEVLTHWGISEHVLNLEAQTLRFCTEVIDEVADIFPGVYFHIGGDECPTTEWASSPRAQELMEANGFSSVHELQGWFTGRMAAHLAKRGRSLVGWDEILKGGAPPGAVVMSWQGEEGGIQAALAGHDVVMTPQEWLYFDWAYANDPAEPLAIRPATSVEKVWGYDPVPDAIPPDLRHHVLGAQCQLWTEYVPTPEHAEYLCFPRLSAFAERAWSRREPSATFEEFNERLAVHLGRLDALGVNYRPLDGPNRGQSRVWRDPRTPPQLTAAVVAERLGIAPNSVESMWIDELAALEPVADLSWSAQLDPDRAGGLLELLGVPEADAADVLATLPSPERTPEWWWCLEREASRLISHMGDSDAPRGIWPSFEGAEHPLERRCHFVHVALATMASTIDYYLALGVPREIAVASLGDVRRHMAIHRRVHGETGIEASWWVARSLRGEIVDLGRLQFNRFRIGDDMGYMHWYGADVAAELGPGFGEGDLCLGIHIPDGSPLRPEWVGEALGEASRFFQKYYPCEVRRVATCMSWLLDDQLAQYLPADSNIVQFQRRFELVPGWYDGDGEILQFVFRAPSEVDLASLPQSSTLERAIVAHLRSGRHWRMRTGWLDLPGDL
ncbi:MAG: family 20 glycosylhydrolase [Acidimicrobiales bacterium]